MNRVFTAPRLPSWNSIRQNYYQRKVSNAYQLCKEDRLVSSRSRNTPVQSNCFIYDFIHLRLHWVCLHCRAGFSLTVASGATLQLWRAGFSLPCLLLLGSRAPVAAACGPTSCFSWVLGHRLSSYSSAACGILPDQESNPCLLHWQADSLPLSHEGSPRLTFYGQHLFLAQA